MAFLQPENIPSRNDLPLRLQAVAKALKNLLPDDVTVWLERTGDDTASLRRDFDPEAARRPAPTTEPYLVVLDPEAGIAVMEAPAISRSRLHLLRNSELDANPLRASIVQRTEALCDGIDARSIQALPVVHVLALPEAHREDLPSRSSVRLLCSEDFEPDALRPALHRIISGRSRPLGPQLPLSPQEETEARAAVNPSILIGGAAQQGLMFGPPDDAEQIRALDRKQERLARHLGGGYRLIRGVAGSGKTLILTHHAKHLAEHFPQWPILLLCFNRALSVALAREVREAGNVRAMTIDRLASETIWATGRQVPDVRRGHEDEDFARRRQEAREAAETLDDSKRYDMVLVDEAQDFGPSGLDLAWAMLKDGREHFVIALDSAQNLYRRRMTWNPPDRTARGRATVLRINYRNTREILDLAQRALRGLDEESSKDPQSDDLDVLVLPEHAARHGHLPRTLVCADLDAEVGAIAARVQELREAGVEPEHIVVLSGSNDLREQVLDTVPGTVDANENRDGAVLARGKVRIATLYWSKGLEFRHVIVGGANHIWVPKQDGKAQDEQMRRLLYVGMTRATQTLTVTCSGEGPMDTIQGVPFRTLGQ